MPRIDRVNVMIKKEIGNIIQQGEISDPRVKFVTIQSVDVSKDLQHARVRFSILSDAQVDIDSAIEGLESCRGYIRKLVGSRIDLRYTPEIQFIFDKGVQHAAYIDQQLEEIKKLKSA